MRIAVCDDQAQYRQQAEQDIRECLRGTDFSIDMYKDGMSFLRGCRKTAYDLVFLDIEMPELDGITLAKQLRALQNAVQIIFLTSHIEFALEGYEVNALRYLTKPLDMQKLREVLSYVLRQMGQMRSLWIKNDLGETKLPVKDILYMEAQNQNIRICTPKQDYCVRYNLGDYEQELSQDGFFRIHRGYLVSLCHIRSVGKSEVTLDNGIILPVSRTKEKPLKEALLAYIRKEAL